MGEETGFWQEVFSQSPSEYAAELLKKGYLHHEIEARLVERGLAQASAATLVSDLTLKRSEAIRRTGVRNMLIGAPVCIAGVVVTAVTCSLASELGYFVVAWGAIVFGALEFFWGLAQLLHRDPNGGRHSTRFDGQAVVSAPPTLDSRVGEAETYHDYPNRIEPGTLDPRVDGALGDMDRERPASNESTSQDQVSQSAYVFAAERLRRGFPPHEIEAALGAKGLDQASSATIVSQVVHARSKAMREAGPKNMLIGALCCVGGITSAVVRLSIASEVGGPSWGVPVLALGVIVFGVFQLFRGLRQLIHEDP